MKTLAVAPQPFFTARGTPLSVYYRCLASLDAGFEVDLLTYGEGVDPDLPGLRIYRIPRIPGLRNIPVGPSFTKLVLDGVLVLWFLARLLKRRYAVVWAHEEAVFFARFFKPIFGYRLVYDMHSSLPRQLESFGFSSSRTLAGLFRWLERQALRHADAVLTISPALEQHALSIMPEAERHLLLENTLVDPVRLRDDDALPDPDVAGPELPANGAIVLYAGTFEAYQGLELLLEAFAILCERSQAARLAPSLVPHLVPHLMLVGGQADQVERLRQKAEGLGIAERVTIGPRVAPSTVERLLERAAVVVSPRTGGNNTPLKIYSCLAHGCALVATRVESHTQVLDERVCWLAEPSPEGLAASLHQALSDGEERERRGAAARSLYAEKYSRERYLAQLGKLYRLLER